MSSQIKCSTPDKSSKPTNMSPSSQVGLDPFAGDTVDLPLEVIEDDKIQFKNEDGKLIYDKFAKKIVEDYNIVRVQNVDGDYIKDRESQLFDFYSDKAVVQKIIAEEFRQAGHTVRTDALNEVYGLTKLNAFNKNIQFDSKLNLLPLNNGVFNIEEGRFIPYPTNHYFTRASRFDFDPNANCQLWIECLLEIFECDESRIRLLQDTFGNCLTNNMKASKFSLFKGDGSDGKSMVLKILLMILHELNVSNVTFEGMGDKHAPATLENMRANIAFESDKNHLKNTAFLKAYSGGDRIQIRPMYRQPYSINPTAQLLFAVNTLPHISDTSWGLLRRISIIPFNRRFDSDSNDPDMLEKLVGNNGLAGIFNWMLEGLDRVKRNNYQFSVSKESLKEFQFYKKTINPLVMFLEDCCETSKTDRECIVDKTFFVTQYNSWRKTHGHKEMAMQTITTELKRLGVEDFRPRINGQQRGHYRGVKILPQLNQTQGSYR